MLFLRSFINLILVPILSVYLSKMANRKEIKPSIELLFQYAVAVSLNIPVTRIITIIIRISGGLNIEADSSYYTIVAILSAMILFGVNEFVKKGIGRETFISHAWELRQGKVRGCITCRIRDDTDEFEKTKLFVGTELFQSKYVFTFTSSLIIFFITHSFFFLNRFSNEDYHHFLHGYTGHPNIGRWLGAIIYDYSIPWLKGVASAILIAMACCVVVEILDIRKNGGKLILCGLMITFPTLAYSFGYLFLSDNYALALLLATLAAFVMIKTHRFFWIGSIFMMLSLAAYQSYIAVIMSLLLFSLLLELCDGIRLKVIVNHVAKYLLGGVLGGVFYLFSVKVSCRISGVSLVDYKGIDKMGQVPFLALPALFGRCYKRFLGFFFSDDFFFTNPFIKTVYLIWWLAFFILILGYTIRNQSIRSRIVIVILIGLIPLCINPIDVIAIETQSSNLNIYAVCLLFTVPIAYYDRGYIHSNSRILYKIVLVCTAIIIGFNLYITNLYYLKAQTYYEKTMLFYNRLYTEICMTDGYKDNMPIFLNTSNAYLITEDNPFPEIIHDQGIWRTVMGMYKPQKAISFMNNIMQLDLECADEKQIQMIIDEGVLDTMEIYPNDDSIEIYKGIVVVNFLDNE